MDKQIEIENLRAENAELKAKLEECEKERDQYFKLWVESGNDTVALKKRVGAISILLESITK